MTMHIGKLKKTFNAEASLKDLSDAIEGQIDALRSDKGVVRTIASLAKDRFKLREAAFDLAETLNVGVDKKPMWDLMNELAAKAEERKIPGAERLKKLQDWNGAFWLQKEVQDAEKENLHLIRAVRTIKQLAQKMPKP
jgi:hypothetical protein